MASPIPPSLNVPDLIVARATAEAWARDDARLGAILSAGVPTARALVRWGAEMLREGRADDAATALRVAAALAPDDPAAWTNLGVALDRSGDPASAVACLKRSVELARDQPDTWLLLGMASERGDDLAGAHEDYRVALELAPASPLAWTCLGALLQRTGDADGAIDAFTAALAHGGPDAAISANLGKLLYEEGQLAEAHAAYAVAIAGAPDNPHFRRMEQRTRFMRDLIEGASVDHALDAARPSADELADLFEASAAALGGFGHHEAALRLAERRVELWPGSAAARYLRASLRGEAEPPRSPDDYLVEAFDAFADGFDAQLVGVLGYDVPEKMCGLVRDLAEPGRRYATLDAGCGTGLCGPLIRPLASRLTGVDLSPKMLDHARGRGVYDELVCEELTGFLQRSPGAYDLVLAADLLVYFGDLALLFRAAADALRKGGLFAVSAERSDERDHVLLPSGRFAHGPSYVRATAAPDFEVLRCQDTTLRREGRERVRGQLFVLQRR